MTYVTNRIKGIRLCAQNMLVLGLLIQTGIVTAQNLVTNPGFETGDTSGWFAFGSPTISAETGQVHSGTYAAQVSNRTATYMGIAQSFLGDLQAGQTYDVSAWVRLVSGGNQTMQLTMQQTDGSGMTYALIASGSVSSSSWTQLSGQYTYNPSGTVSTLTFYAEVPSSSNASYYIDDVQLGGGTIVTNPPINGTSTVDWNNVHQRIDGFGASSAYNGSWNTAEADLLFSTNNNISYQSGTYNGIGLSLLRNHIVWANTTSASDTPTTAETIIMQMAQTRGARIWSTPWTPSPGFKDSGVVNGGNYLGSGANPTNLAYASQLANYVASMKNTYGVNLYAISIQNEPDGNHPDTYVTNSGTGIITTNVGYDSCVWTGQKIHDFTTNLYNALVTKSVSSTKIMLPESQNWTDPQNLAATTMNDSSVAADVGIIADHNYDGANGPANLVKNNYGKALWETEVSQLGGETSDIANGIYYAQRIFLFMTVAQANAWHYWWIIPFGSETGLMTQNAGTTKRMFTIGNYSRFVRPNFYRVDATSTPPSALISAYKDSTSPAFAIVVVNTNAATDVIQTFNLANFTAASVTPWITSGTLSLAQQSAVNVTNASFTYTVPAMSVVTFVGQGHVVSSNITISKTSYIPDEPSFILTWNSTTGATYSVIKTNVLGSSAATWPAIVTGYPAGGAAGGPLSYTDAPATGSPAFYKVSSP